ncbi:unnamed protein product [Boreogadus saida]
MDNDAPCAMAVQRPLVDTTGRPGGPAPAHRPRTAVRLPKFSGVTQLEPYLAQFRLAAWHNGWCTEEAVVHLALALEGTAARVLLDLDQEDQRDLQALIRALERRLALDPTQLPRNSPRYTGGHWRSTLSCGDCSRRAWGSMSASPSPRPLMRLWTRRNRPEGSSGRVASVTRLGHAAAPGHKERGSGKGRVRTATLPATKKAEASRALWRHDRADFEPQQCRQLGLVEDCGWTGQRATHPRPSRRRGRRKARRRRVAEDGVPEPRSRGPLQQNLVGAPKEVVPDHTPRSSADSWRRASQPERKAAPQRGRYWPGPRRRSRPPEQSGLCSGCWGRRDV